MKNIYIILATVIILAFSDAVNIHRTVSGHKSIRILFEEGRIYYLKHTPISVQECSMITPKVNVLFYDVICTYSIGLWIPALILLTLHIAMYRKLQRQAQIRTQTSTMDSTQQMKQIMQTFSMIVIAFYICMLPHTFLSSYYAYTMTFHKSINIKLFIIMNVMFTCLRNVNSCINPLIYAKIHRKIYVALKRLWDYLARCQRCRLKSYTTTQQPDPTFFGMSPTKRTAESENSNDAYQPSEGDIEFKKESILNDTRL